MKKFFSIILALGAVACGIAAGHLFYLEKFASGIAMLIMTLIFLSYAMNRNAFSYEYSSSESESLDEELDGIITDPDKTLGDTALLLADIAVNNLKNIGRTIPASTKEITELEDKLNNLLNQCGVPFAQRDNLKDEFEKLKGRTRLNEGGAAIVRNSRL